MTIKIQENFDNLFNENESYTFLAGAGISMSPPSSLPSAQQFIKVLLEYCVPKGFQEYIYNIENLRYELLVEEVQRVFDPELRFLDYLESQTDSNLIHFFLANCISKGHNIITTNFDYLIEHAIYKLENKALIKDFSPIISKSDFLQFYSKKKV